MNKALTVMALLCMFFAGCFTASVIAPQALATPAPVQFTKCTGVRVPGNVIGNFQMAEIPQGWTVVGGGLNDGIGVVYICS